MVPLVAEEQPVRLVYAPCRILYRLGRKPFKYRLLLRAMLYCGYVIGKGIVGQTLACQPVEPPVERDTVVVHDAEAVNEVVQNPVFRPRVHLVSVRLHLSCRHPYMDMRSICLPSMPAFIPPLKGLGFPARPHKICAMELNPFRVVRNRAFSFLPGQKMPKWKKRFLPHVCHG